MLRVIIVDDELPVIGDLAHLLQASGQVEIVGTFSDPYEALEQVGKIRIDAAFLDIEMPGMDGISLADRIALLDGRIDVVFVTAFNEYAVDAFEVHAQDYLLKPVAKERLNKTLRRLTGSGSAQSAPPRTQQLNVSCFGKFSVHSGNNAPVKWRTSKTEELLAYLVDKNGACATRDIIINALWGHMDEKRAMANLNTCSYNLRKTLAAMGCAELLSIEQGTFKLDASRMNVDASFFQQYGAEMERIDDANIDKFREALQTYKGGYLALNYYEWASQRREQFEEVYMQMTMGVARYEADAGNVQGAIKLLKTALTVNELHTVLNEQLLKLYVGAKDFISAAKHRDAYRRKLKKEFGSSAHEDFSPLFFDTTD